MSTIRPSTEALFIATKASFLRSADDDTSKTVVGVAKAVYIQIAQHCDDNLTCYPSHKRLVASTCFSRCSVIRALDWLVDNGYLAILEKGRPGKSTRYLWINKENLSVNALVKAVQPVKSVRLASLGSTRDRSVYEDLSDTSWAD